jgi:hypothetical protein
VLATPVAFGSQNPLELLDGDLSANVGGGRQEVSLACFFIVSATLPAQGIALDG